MQRSGEGIRPSVSIALRVSLSPPFLSSTLRRVGKNASHKTGSATKAGQRQEAGHAANAPFRLPVLPPIEQFAQLLRRHILPDGIADRPIDLTPLFIPLVPADAERNLPVPLPAFPFRRLPRRARRAHRLDIRFANILLAEPTVLTPESRVVDVPLVSTLDRLLADDAGQFSRNVL